MMLSAGEPLPWLSNQMGHSNVLTTAKIYAKFILSAQPDAGDKASKIFGSIYDLDEYCLSQKPKMTAFNKQVHLCGCSTSQGLVWYAPRSINPFP